VATIPVIAIPIAKLHPSPFNPRVRQNRTALDELKASMKEKGVLTALIVRPNADGYEVIAGSRRLAAAKELGWVDLPCVVHELTDEEAAEIALVDNLLRTDIDPLDEARGFVELLKKTRDLGAIAARVGKSRSYIAQRMKLVNLLPAVQKALQQGKIELGVALELAKIPQEAQKEFVRYAEDSSVDSMKRMIERNVMLDLSGAPWKKDDAELVPDAGACNACPKRTAADRDLFGDAGKHDRCLDAKCFEAKMKAFFAHRKTELEAKGDKVVQISTNRWSSGDSKKLVGKYMTSGDWSTAGKTCKDPHVGLVVAGSGIGQVKRICTGEKCKLCGSKNGSDGIGDQSWKKKAAAERKRIARESRYRQALFGAIEAKELPWNDEVIVHAARELAEGQSFDNARRLANAMGLQAGKKYGHPDYCAAVVKYAGASPGAARRALFLFPLAGDLDVNYGHGAGRLEKTARALKLDPARIRKSIEDKSKKPAPKAGKAKKARKRGSR
jgi:ParB family chromosome partitioning protein